jgi:hypothetical protein
MPNYFLHTEPDANDNFRLHLEHCPHIQNTKSISYLGEFDDLSTDYAVSLCTDCIDINFAKPISERKQLIASLLDWFRYKK